MIFPKRFADDIQTIETDTHFMAFICFDKVASGSYAYAVQAKTESEAIRKLIREFDLTILMSSRPVSLL